MEKDNTRYIAEQIFSEPPGEPNSINLSLDESTVDFMEKEGYNNHEFIRDIITTITLHGIEILFGHRNVMELNEDEVFLLKRYIRSYGYEVKIKVEERTIFIAFERIFN